MRERRTLVGRLLKLIMNTSAKKPRSIKAPTVKHIGRIAGAGLQLQRQARIERVAQFGQPCGTAHALLKTQIGRAGDAFADVELNRYAVGC